MMREVRVDGWRPLCSEACLRKAMLLYGYVRAIRRRFCSCLQGRRLSKGRRSVILQHCAPTVAFARRKDLACRIASLPERKGGQCRPVRSRRLRSDFAECLPLQMQERASVCCTKGSHE